MRKIGLFFINFGVSLIAYVASIFLGFFWLMAISMPVSILLDFGSFDIVGYILLWHISLMFAVLFFLFGTKLNLLGKHWSSHLLNYLSVCGIFVITLLVAHHSHFVFSVSWLIFPLFLPFQAGDGFSKIVILIVVTFLPSLFIWLGMVYKSRKLKKKQTEVID